MSEAGVRNWVLVAEVDKLAHRVVVFPQSVYVPLFSLYIWKLQSP
jgi:hypothetical protein